MSSYYVVRVGNLGGVIIHDPLKIIAVGLILGIPFGLLAGWIGFF
jgi:hypothetical protein